MTTTNAAIDKTDKTSEKAAAEKVGGKLAERRRALGRGLESLLPGPRVVTATPTLPQSTRKDGAPAGNDGAPDSPLPSTSITPAASSLSASSFPADSGRPGAAVATHVGVAANSAVATRAEGLAEAGTVDRLQAVASGWTSERTSDRTSGDESVFVLDLDQIGQNPYQTRTEFDPKALTDLAGSIQSQGVIQPIVVRPAVPPHVRPEPAQPGEVKAEGKERFILILGERRYRASKMAGKTTIPAIVKRVSEQQAAEMTVVENLQRQDLECLDQALAFAKLSLEFKLTQEDIGKRVGVSREQVTNYLRLLKLPDEVQVALRNKDLSYSHARLLLALDDDAQITKVARVAIAKKMSVALLEEMVRDLHVPKVPAERKEGGARWMDPNVRAAQRSLEAALGMRVRIRDRKGKGKITIEYGTLEDFDRVVTMLKGK